MWRLEGWEEIKEANREKAHEEDWDREDCFEAGADAMLGAIWKLAKDSPTGTFTFDTNTINIFGVKE